MEMCSAHGDLKPSNIFVVRQEGGDDFDIKLKLGDFDRSGKIKDTVRDNDVSLTYCKCQYFVTGKGLQVRLQANSTPRRVFSLRIRATL